MVNTQMLNFVRRVGELEAPQVARFYLGHGGNYYVTKMHSVGAMLADAEKLRTEWATGQKVTGMRARSSDAVEHAKDQMRRIDEGTL